MSDSQTVHNVLVPFDQNASKSWTVKLVFFLVATVMVLTIRHGLLESASNQAELLRVSAILTDEGENGNGNPLDYPCDQPVLDAAAARLRERLAGVKKVAVFSTDNKPFYSFSTPFAAWAWKHRIGYTPIVLVPEDFHPFVASKIEEAGGIVYYINRQAHGLGAEHEASVMQTGRVLASALPLDDDALLITADADMVPVGKSFFDNYNSSYTMHAFNGLFYINIGWKQYAICYVMGPVWAWRQAMEITKGDTIEGLAAKLYKEEKRDMPFLHWNFDQHYLYSQIEKFKKDDPLFIEELPGGPRMDRGKWWVYNEVTNSTADAHVPRPGYTPEVWPLFYYVLLRPMMSPKTLEWAVEYRNIFVRDVSAGIHETEDMGHD